MRFYLYLVLFGLLPILGTQEVTANEIAEKEISELREEMSSIDPKQSSTRLRREYKNLIRNIEKLVEKNSEADNRFLVYHILLQCQVKLLALDKSDRTREELFETCEKLSKAPDVYADERLDADIFLSDRDLTQNEATIADRVKELHRIIKLYKGTSAELKSLMSAVNMADQIQDFEAKNEFAELIEERFADDPYAIAFVRKQVGFLRMDAIFSGTFEDVEGQVVHFPVDRMGHNIMPVFWSTSSDNVRNFLSQIKEKQELNSHPYEIYSFNLDQLEDGGASIIKEVGLDCRIMKVPDGFSNQAYITYAGEHPHAFPVSTYGRKIFDAKAYGDETWGHFGKKHAKVLFQYPLLMPSEFRGRRQLQALFNGDFLIHALYGTLQGKSAVEKKAMELRTMLPEEPLRNRMTPSESSKVYSEIVAQCDQFMSSNPAASDLWNLRNLKIVSLMGLWSNSGDSKFMDQALGEAEKITSAGLSFKQEMIARFCKVRSVLRKNRSKGGELVEEFIKESEGLSSDSLILASASVLALNANHIELYNRYREKFLGTSTEGPHSLMAFMKSRYHQRYIFKGDIRVTGPGRPERNIERYYVANNAIESSRNPFPSPTFLSLDGVEKKLPGSSGKNLKLVLFVEPPTSGNVLFNSRIYQVPSLEAIAETKRKMEAYVAIKSKKERKKAPRPPRYLPQPSGAIHHFQNLAKLHLREEVDFVVVLLGDDVDQIKAIKERYRIEFEILRAPGGIHHPIVKKLGLFSTDVYPNAYLIRRDGTIAWSAKGYDYRVEPRKQARHYEIAIKNHLFRCEVEAGYQALVQKNYTKAEKYFQGPYEVPVKLELLDNWRQSGGRTEWHKWTSTQHFGRTLALLGQGRFEDALGAIQDAKTHHMIYFRQDEKKPSAMGVGMHRVHAYILEEMGRITEARTARSSASMKPTAYPTHEDDFRGWNLPYERFFTEKMMKLDLPALSEK